MSDQRIQELRKSSLTDPTAVLAYLRARARTGDEDARTRIEVLAYCGHKGALEVINTTDLENDWGHARGEGEHPEDGDYPEECEKCGWWLVHQVGCEGGQASEFAKGFSRWGTRTLVRAGLAAAEVVAEEVFGCSCSSAYIEGYGCSDCKNTGYTGHGSTRAARTLEAIEAWVRDPSPENQARCIASNQSLSGYWIAWLDYLLRAITYRELQSMTPATSVRRAVVASRRVLGTKRTRAVIQKAMTDWALKGDS